MSKFRSGKISAEIQREVSRMLRDDIKDPRIKGDNLSVTRVDVSSDGSHARVYISVLGDESEGQQVIRILNRAVGFLRSGVARSLKIKNAPELELRLDRSIEQGIRISTILSDSVSESMPLNEEGGTDTRPGEETDDKRQ